MLTEWHFHLAAGTNEQREKKKSLEKMIACYLSLGLLADENDVTCGVVYWDIWYVDAFTNHFVQFLYTWRSNEQDGVGFLEVNHLSLQFHLLKWGKKKLIRIKLLKKVIKKRNVLSFKSTSHFASSIWLWCLGRVRLIGGKIRISGRVQVPAQSLAFRLAWKRFGPNRSNDYTTLFYQEVKIV